MVNRRSAFLSGLGGVASHVHDANRGQGLPSVVGDDSYRRLSRALERRTARHAPAPEPEPAQTTEESRRFASIAEVERAGFKRVASCMYQAPVGWRAGMSASAEERRTAHSIWELRAAEDGEGVLLVRQREERAVDLRHAAGGGGAGPGTAAAVASGIVRAAGMQRTAQKHTVTKAASPRRGAQQFTVSLFQIPGGDVAQRRTLITEEVMALEDLERLVGEMKLGPAELTHDTWSDGEWELRVRGPKGQLIHGFDSTGPDEIGGEKGRALIQTIGDAIAAMTAEHAGLPEPIDEGELADSLEGDEGLLGTPPPEEGAMPPDPDPGAGAAPPPDAGGLPPPGPLAPSAAALKKGTRLLVYKKGQVADAVLMLIRPDEKALKVMFDGGEVGSVPFSDVIEPSLEIDDPEPSKEKSSDKAAGQDDDFIEIGSDALNAGSGGASHDPFDAFARSAMRRLAIEFGDAFRPGGHIQVTQPFTSFFEQRPVQAGEVFMMEGFHRSMQDGEYGYGQLADPFPGADPFENIRVRLQSDAGQPLIVTVEELDKNFGMPAAAPPDETAVPELPGESVFDMQPEPTDRPEYAPTYVRPQNNDQATRPIRPQPQV